MLQRSFREHPRLWLLILAPTFLMIETACNGPTASDSGQKSISDAAARAYIRAGEGKHITGFKGGVQVYPPANVTTQFAAVTNPNLHVYGNYTGNVDLTPPAHVHGLAGFTKGTFKAGAKAGYISVANDRAKGTATVLVKFAAHGVGTLCVHLAWTTNSSQQEIRGTFAALGGTGRAARLHDHGKFAAVQAVPFVSKGQVALYGTPSLGKSRGIPKGCGSIKPPPPPKGVTASIAFSGFAASVGPPPPSATLYQSTVSDATLCKAGGGLYAVFAYTGPASATTLQLGVFGPSGSGVSHNLTPKPGLNAVLMAKNPKNGSYSFKGQLVTKSGGSVSGNTVVYSQTTVSAGC